ncbi:MAG: hypothetical protein ACKPKO_05185, partial [Candidatus Fonsibacter sp.]
DHYSQSQMELIAKPLGPGNIIVRDASRDTDVSKGSSNSRGKSKGRSKGKGQLKGRSAGAQSEADLPPDDDGKWCPAYSKDDYDTGEACPSLHADKEEHGNRGHHNRGRSPSRDGKGKNSRWRRRSNELS